MENVYASNAVSHMMSGKAGSRAMRGHLLVNTALNTLVIEKAVGIQYQKNREQSEALQEEDAADPMPKTNKETSTNQEEQLISAVELPALDASSCTRKELMDKSKEDLLTAYSQLQSDEQNMAQICESSEIKEILTTMQKTEDNMKLQSNVKYYRITTFQHQTELTTPRLPPNR